MYHAGITALNYTDTSLTNGTAYFYEVRATGSTAFSNEASATPFIPTAPANLAATTASGNVVLTWTSSSSTYAIYRGCAPSSETLLDTGLTGTTYTDAGLANGTTYYYKVQALNAGGSSPLSSEIAATPTGPAAQSWSGTINFGLPGEPVQTCTASIADINRPVLCAFFALLQGPYLTAIANKYNAITFSFEALSPPYNFGTTSNLIQLPTAGDGHVVAIVDFRWQQLSAQRIQAALTAAAQAVPSHPEIQYTGVVFHGFSEGIDDENTALAQTLMANRALAVIDQSEIDEDHFNPLTVVDTVPSLFQASGAQDINSSLNLGLGDYSTVTHDVCARGLATNQGAPLTVLNSVDQGHGGAPDHPFNSIWLDSILSQRLPARLPTTAAVNLPSWQYSTPWAGTYNISTSSNSPWGSSGNPGVELTNNVVSSKYAYTDSRPFTWLPSQNTAAAWLAYNVSGTFSAFAPVILSAATATATTGSAFAYQITAGNEPTTYAATGPNGTAPPRRADP